MWLVGVHLNIHGTSKMVYGLWNNFCPQRLPKIFLDCTMQSTCKWQGGGGMLVSTFEWTENVNLNDTLSQIPTDGRGAWWIEVG